MATDDWQASGLTSDPQLLAERKGIGLSATIIDTASVVGHSQKAHPGWITPCKSKVARALQLETAAPCENVWRRTYALLINQRPTECDPNTTGCTRACLSLQARPERA
jgi:hypothetical protein